VNLLRLLPEPAVAEVADFAGYLVRKHGRLAVDEQTARRKVTAWLVSEVGNMLVGEMPQLVIGERTLWRVPVMLTSSRVGSVGQVGTVDVDAVTGELVVDEQMRERILDNVKALASSALSSVE
jgi:hypothetical protein